jgi:hypothetical protein
MLYAISLKILFLSFLSSFVCASSGLPPYSSIILLVVVSCEGPPHVALPSA